MPAGFRLLRFVDLTSAGPARLFGIAAQGPHRRRLRRRPHGGRSQAAARPSPTRWIASRAGWTPYDGVTVTGWPVGTFVRGHKVMWEGSLTAPAQGERVRFLETLAS